jgi:thiol-disulfide isomerase/thioredoxin
MSAVEMEKKKGFKPNAYLIVFGIIGIIIVIAALSTFVFNKNLSAPKNVSLSSLQNYGPAPNVQGVSAWINSPPLNVSKLKGKVVLVDFWTYSCINCIRSIPHIEAWQKEYGNNGLVIIGVSTPEFQFEHNYSNVAAAVKKFGITYAVALDNNYSTWDAYNNQYWPADYIIDKNGDIRYVALGEGGYNTTEQVIRELLQNAGYVVPSNLTNSSLGVNFSGIGTPELYLGYDKARAPLGNSQGFTPNTIVNYTFTNVSQVNEVYFSGPWYNAPDSMIAVNNQSKLYLVFKAKNVNIVASGNYSNIIVKLDNQNLTQNYLGSDDHLSNGEAVAQINSSRLYNIVSAPTYSANIVEIDASKGFRVYTFTFG